MSRPKLSAKSLLPAAILSFSMLATMAFAQSQADLNLPATSAAAPAASSSLTKLQVVGFGTGGYSMGACTSITCKTGDTCRCVTGTDTLSGSAGAHGNFSKGTLTETLSLDITTNTLPIGAAGGGCFAIGGNATITVGPTRSPSTADMLISGVSCDVIGSGTGLLVGTYVFTGGTGQFSSVSGSGNFSQSTAIAASGAQSLAFTGGFTP